MGGKKRPTKTEHCSVLHSLYKAY